MLIINLSGGDRKLERNEILINSVRGCLFGGALGDAMGWPVEFKKIDEIKNVYGEKGIDRFILNDKGKIEITDDTQMTLYTAIPLLP